MELYIDKDKIYTIDEKVVSINDRCDFSSLTDISPSDEGIRILENTDAEISGENHRIPFKELLQLTFSNNWLKLHGIPMRRRANSRRHISRMSKWW